MSIVVFSWLTFLPGKNSFVYVICSWCAITSCVRALFWCRRLVYRLILIFRFGPFFFHYNFCFPFPVVLWATVSLCAVSCSSSRVIGISWRTTKQNKNLLWCVGLMRGSVPCSVSPIQAMAAQRPNCLDTTKQQHQKQPRWMEETHDSGSNGFVYFSFFFWSNFALRMRYQFVRCFVNWSNYFHSKFVLIQSFTVSVEGHPSCTSGKQPATKLLNFKTWLTGMGAATARAGRVSQYWVHSTNRKSGSKSLKYSTRVTAAWHRRTVRSEAVILIYSTTSNANCKIVSVSFYHAHSTFICITSYRYHVPSRCSRYCTRDRSRDNHVKRHRRNKILGFLVLILKETAFFRFLFHFLNKTCREYAISETLKRVSQSFFPSFELIDTK